MTGFFKSLFGLGESQGGARRLSHPRDLREDDIIKFGYIEQPDLSNTEFEVSHINTYIYGDLCYPELILKDRSGNLVYMMVEEEDGDEYLALCKKIQKSKVSEVIGDARYLAVEDINRQKKFTSHILEDPTEEYAIEIEI